MGYGAFMVMNNKNTDEVQVYVTASTCMYDRGEDGSNLSLFNNVTVPGNGSLPSSGSQYIEAKNSGSCFFDNACFTLKLEDVSGTLIGTLDFEDSGDNWSCTNSNTTVVDVYINNSADQARITITIESIALTSGPPQKQST